MADKSKISWTDSSWNPVTGCERVSPGCDNCYAFTFAERMRGATGWPVGFDLQLRPKALYAPFRWKAPRRIFVNSMSDLFWHAIPEPYLRDVWQVMLQADQHIYQVLTKRPHLARQKIERLGLKLAPHIWLGVSVERQRFADHRIPELLRIAELAEDPRRIVLFLSCEPLLGPLDLMPYIDPTVVVTACQVDTTNPRTVEALTELAAAFTRLGANNPASDEVVQMIAEQAIAYFVDPDEYTEVGFVSKGVGRWL